MKKFYTFNIIFICLCNVIFAQIPIPMPKVPLMRELSHINIDNAQKAIFLLSGNDSIFKVSADESVNLQISQMLQVEIDNLQAEVELDTSILQPQKFIWLRSIEGALKEFVLLYKRKRVKAIELGDLITAYKAAFTLEKEGKTILPVIEETPLEIGKMLYTNEAFKQNIGLSDCYSFIVLKEATLHPENILQMLLANSNLPHADSLISMYALYNPESLYDYASGNYELSRKIKASKHPLVQLICKLTRVESGRLYFPFLDKLYTNQLNLETIGKAIASDDSYFKLLAATQIEYAKRMELGEKPMVSNVLTAKLKEKSVEFYIDAINSLHDESNELIRFKKIDNLAPAELYYLCALGEEEIYTSSYLGVYKRIFERIKSKRSDSLLIAVNYDHFKKFIKMAAAYNTLDDFLKKMPPNIADEVMKRFVGNLTTNKSLEDAVDVANSFASISDVKLQKLILSEVKNNLLQAQANNQTTAVGIYNILNIIFSSVDTTLKVDISKELHIPPVFQLPVASLLDTASKKIIVQQFFYGDKDGRNVYDAFISSFRNANWRIVNKKEWSEISSLKSKIPIVIYSNKPLDELKDLDATAQKNLCNYLDSMNYQPTVVLHRGHSYYLKSTIDQLAPSAQLILLGSCGSYQSLNSVLEICPDAHIISSKQVGTGIINQGIINVIADNLRLGKNINWPQLWKGLEKQFIGITKERFDDYVPPHKNLGAIFITAYNKYLASIE